MLPATTEPPPLQYPFDYTDGALVPAPDPGGSSSSVQPPEIKPPDTRISNDWGYYVTSDDAAVTFRHSGWAHARSRIRAAMVALFVGPRRVQRFDLCGSEPWIAVDENDPHNVAILTNHCKSRWCVPCSRERAARVVGNLTAKIALAPVRFLTLTMKHSDAPLRHQIDRIYDCFRKLRRADFWTPHVDGGAAILEIKHSLHDSLWHVHLHCLIQGRYVPHALIKAEWWRITGDSNVVDIRPIWNTTVAARYITKYLTKPIASSVINKPLPLQELIGACGRRRLVLTWGSWRGLRLTAKLDTTTWRTICPLDELYLRVDEGDPDAKLLLAALQRCCPDAPQLVNRSPPVRRWTEETPGHRPSHMND